MVATPASLEVPKKPAHRRAWVKYQLELKGLNYSSLGKRIGVSHQAVKDALQKPSAHIEEAIAAVIGVPVQQLFPERFDDSGKRLHRVRTIQRTGNQHRRNAKATRRAN